MHQTVLSFGLDNLVVAIPFVVMLLAAFFRLDELFATPKKHPGNPRHPCGIDENGDIILCDPDGRRWNGRRMARQQPVVRVGP
jgi:hypothetical protein